MEIAKGGALFSFDQDISQTGARVAGIDEAGRGPLAGPVVAAAVVFHRQGDFLGLNDSKKISAAKREKLFPEVAKNALIGIGLASEAEIDELNIYQATRVAMKRALLDLSHTPDIVLVDGNMTLDIPLNQKAIVKGDQKSASIAAASIVAKVYRDALMVSLDKTYPQYLFSKHKGYPTKEHIEKIREFGPSPAHRKSFAPVGSLLGASS